MYGKYIKSDIFISCFDCDGCDILYDPIHDEHFSEGCGLVILSNNLVVVDVDSHELNIKLLVIPTE